ncbi:WhiB family transcriptional regulator [Streptomyces goshikiensis]|uniref:WhiB family transcriptional regulator n=1 Tax=Streptomyces goshikiensis TaxID=1942 RepID=UPI00364E24F5
MPRPSRYAPDTLPHPPSWRDDAACTEIDTPVFFSPNRSDIAYVKTVCISCPVRPDCLTHALTHREDYGVWGGLDEDERNTLLRDAHRAAERQRRLQREKERKADATAAA